MLCLVVQNRDCGFPVMVLERTTWLFSDRCGVGNQVAGGFIEGVQMPGALPLIAAAALLIGAVIVASLMPAARASRVDVLKRCALRIGKGSGFVRRNDSDPSTHQGHDVFVTWSQQLWYVVPPKTGPAGPVVFQVIEVSLLRHDSPDPATRSAPLGPTHALIAPACASRRAPAPNTNDTATLPAAAHAARRFILLATIGPSCDIGGGGAEKLSGDAGSVK